MTFPFTLKLFSLNTVRETGLLFILARGSYPQISLFEAAIIPGVGLRGGEEAAVRTGRRCPRTLTQTGRLRRQADPKPQAEGDGTTCHPRAGCGATETSRRH